MVNLITKLDNHLKEEQVKKKAEPYHGKWRPSMFGRCFRAQYLTRMNEPQTNPAEGKTLRVFEIGNRVHEMIQELVPDECCEVEFDVEDVCGHADIVIEDIVWDIKSIRSYGYRKMVKDEYDIVTDKENYILQLMSYVYFLKKKQGVLLFFEKDGADMKEFMFQMEDWVVRVEKELGTLRKFWELQSMPAPVPRCYNGKECSYCSYKDKCDSLRVF